MTNLICKEYANFSKVASGIATPPITEYCISVLVGR
jgi:hypothetical protein